jgi:hypothetical protein
MSKQATNAKISVVNTQAKVCKPFLIEVMVFSPESGFKFKVVVERSCTPEADELWKLVFDLYSVAASDGTVTETQLVHVSYTTATPVEAKSVQMMASEGVKQPQADVLVNEVHPAAKAISDSDPTADQKKALKQAMSKVVNVQL